MNPGVKAAEGLTCDLCEGSGPAPKYNAPSKLARYSPIKDRTMLLSVGGVDLGAQPPDFLLQRPLFNRGGPNGLNRARVEQYTI